MQKPGGNTEPGCSRSWASDVSPGQKWQAEELALGAVEGSTETGHASS